MSSYAWQLSKPIPAIIFDCDGTLSTLEGIDQLAKESTASEVVARLTENAMSTTGLTPDLYKKRLDFVQPTRTQVFDLGNDYFRHQVPDVFDVIALLTRLQKQIYLVSAGLYPAVKIFGEQLQIPSHHIFAVDIEFDTRGNYVDFDQQSPLVTNTGKRIIVEQLREKHQELIYIGDGLNDYAVCDLVTRFIGYGGVFYREKIAAFSDYYISTPSMTTLLPLVLTQEECEQLSPPEVLLYKKGLLAMQNGQAKFP